MNDGVTVQELTRKASHVLSLLVAGHYDEIEWMSRGGRLSAHEIRQAVQRYGRSLIEPPTSAPDWAWLAIEGASPPQWVVDVALYTREEGLSDLTLCLRLKRRAPGQYDVRVEDLRVL